MKTIFKYQVGPDPEETIHDVPTGFKIVHVEQEQSSNKIAVWAAVNTDAPLVPIHFYVTGTGHPLPEAGIYCGTAVMRNGFVWHVFMEAL